MKPRTYGFGLSLLATVLVAGLVTPAFAQDVRPNPFLPQATSDEAKLLAEKERMRQAVREMMPDIKAMLMPTLDEQKQTLLAEAVEGVLSKVKEDPSILGATGGVAPAAGIDPLVPTLGPNGIPADAKFISCMNGKALYRDLNGIKYVEDAAARCAQ